MKLISLILITLFSIATLQDSKLNLICQKWRLFGLKECDKANSLIRESRASTLVINRDGTYERNIPDMYRTKGEWHFNSDSSKLMFMILERQGKGMEPRSLEPKFDSIVKLTRDTLIYCSSNFNYKQKKLEYTNWYFVKEQ